MRVAALTASSITVGDVSNTEFGYLNGVTSAIQTQIDTKSPSNNPTFTGTVTLPATITSGSSVITFPGSTSTLATSADLSSSLANYLTTSSATATYAPLAQSFTTPQFTSNNYTLVSGDSYKVLLCTNSTTAGTVTVPSGVFSAGQVITITQTGTGQLTLTASGTTINSFNSQLKLAGQYATVQLICTASNTFTAIGNVTA
jgi:hypothetical protein